MTRINFMFLLLFYWYKCKYIYDEHVKFITQKDFIECMFSGEIRFKITYLS